MNKINDFSWDSGTKDNKVLNPQINTIRGVEDGEIDFLYVI